ncbi:Thioredoxin reductase 3 [Nymphon striatum]|nr:Thioredoxin reductase 3 [Nymphon striatum]
MLGSFIYSVYDVDELEGAKIKRSAGSPIFMGVVGSSLKMAPTRNVSSKSTDVGQIIDENIADNPVMIFSKSTCPFCKKIKALLKSSGISYGALELNKLENGEDIQKQLSVKTGQNTVPNVFIRGHHVGGHDDTVKAHEEGKVLELLNPPQTDFEYDVIVIGGGSGGLAASKEATRYGKKVAVCDLVKPTPIGTAWGLGGTCVNVGCIPKKLMHNAAILGIDSKMFGWEVSEKVNHNWETMKNKIQDYIGSLNWGYRVQLREKEVKYVNAYAQFTDSHTIKCVDKKGRETTMSSQNFIIATGERPRYPNIPGAKEFCITSDDLFSLPYSPGKTLVIGASYVALECAGFLAGIGLDVTVMVRSIFLRGFDQDMAERIGKYMEKNGVKFIRPCNPTSIERLEEGKPGKLKVKATNGEGELIEDEYNTVLIAIGRDPCTHTIGIENTGVKMNKSGTFPVVNEQTNIPHIYAVGDILEDKPKLTPVAIQAGKFLSRRIFGGSKEQVDYINVPTTVFTPLEYGCIGYSEEDAIAQFGENNIEVYHNLFQPLEYTLPGRGESDCYLKLICNKDDDERVVGFHYLGPNAGEVTQGYAVSMRLGARKEDFDATIGIHPTTSELFTTLSVRKGSGEEITKSGC